LDDKIRINATEIEHFLENGEGLDDFVEILEKALDMLKSDGGPTFVLGSVIVVNDLEPEEDEEEESEDEESEGTETKKEA
jgi:hypothetical protein